MGRVADGVVSGKPASRNAVCWLCAQAFSRVIKMRATEEMQVSIIHLDPWGHASSMEEQHVPLAMHHLLHFFRPVRTEPIQKAEDGL